MVPLGMSGNSLLQTCKDEVNSSIACWGATISSEPKLPVALKRSLLAFGNQNPILFICVPESCLRHALLAQM